MNRLAGHFIAIAAFLLLATACGGSGGGDDQMTPPTLPTFQSPPDDALFAQLWHLVNTGQGGGTAGQDINVTPAWTAGRTGMNTRVVIIDDGLDIAHEDFAGNVVAAGGLDIDNGDMDPTPDAGAGPNAPAHGTGCGGVAAAVGHNALGVTGVAPRAQLAGVRDNTGTDANYATAVTHNLAESHIYSMSFGPDDNGGVYPLPAVARAALDNGIATGRGGLGAIYVVAAGNGGNAPVLDYANLDGSQNYFGMITVGSVNAMGVKADYSELSSSTLVCTPSNDTTAPLPAITTTDNMGANGYEDPAGNYTNSFGGTSSACPLAAGVVALILEANPNLGWRDVRRILATTARQNDAGDGDWAANESGEMVNHKYGYGVVDAAAAVAAAPGWTNLPAMMTFNSPPSNPAAAIPDAGLTVNDMINVAGSGLTQIDHVSVILNITHAEFRDLRIALTSPAGTVSILTVSGPPPGPQPTPANLELSTNRLIGETTVDGNWTLSVQDQTAGNAGTLVDWRLVIRGH